MTIPAIDKALKAVIAAAKRNKLIPSAFGGSPEACKHFSGLGFKFIPAATDVGLMAAGAKAMQDALAKV